jgi:sugar lactone lactonase YvrE
MSSTVLINNTGTTPNGVVIDEANDRAVIVNWGSSAPILAVDLSTEELSTVVANSGLGNLDGIDMDGEGRFYVSSWSPARITRYSNDFSTSESVVQGAGSGLANPADISQQWEWHTIVPLFRFHQRDQFNA